MTNENIKESLQPIRHNSEPFTGIRLEWAQWEDSLFYARLRSTVTPERISRLIDKVSNAKPKIAELKKELEKDNDFIWNLRLLNIEEYMLYLEKNMPKSIDAHISIDKLRELEEKIYWIEVEGLFNRYKEKISKREFSKVLKEVYAIAYILNSDELKNKLEEEYGFKEDQTRNMDES